MSGMSDSPTPARAVQRDPRLRMLAEESGYEVISRIGAGGMGIVYRARDADGRDVAIKLLRPEIADDPRARERLEREVSAQQRVRHENIVRVLDAELESPEAFVVTDFVPGPTLEDAVREHGALHPEAVREIGIVLGETLRDIHAAGIVHRDLKPSNILLRRAQVEDLTQYDPDGPGLDPVIIDFGIAQAAEQSRLTSTGLVMGTAAYLDPEVARTNITSAASDWWSWAAVLAFAATAREPFGSGRAEIVFFRADRGELDVDGLPTELAGWLRDALRADPQRREDPADLLARLEDIDLERFDDPGPTEVLTAGGPDRTQALPVAGAATAALAAGGAGDATEALRGGDATEALPRVESDATQALPVTDAPQATPVENATATQALPVADADATQVLPAVDADATQALPRAVSPSPADAEATQALPVTDPDRTQVLPAIGADASRGDARIAGAERTEAVPTTGTEEPATEVIAPVRADTRVMPAIRDDDDIVPPRSADAGPVRRALEAFPAAASGYQPSAPGYRASPQGYPSRDAYAPAPAPMAQPAPYGYGPGGQPLAPGGYAMPVPPPRRPLLVWLGHAVLVALAGVAPYVSLVLLLVLGALARTWERSHRTVAAGRARGKGTGAAWGAGVASLPRFALGLVEIALTALFPLVLGVLLAVSADAVCHFVLARDLPASALTAGAVAVTLLLTWFGIGGRTTRDGAHRMLDAAAPDRVWALVVGGLLVLLLGAVIATAFARGGEVDYIPFSSWPRLDALLPWRA